MTETNPEISIIVPVYNEQASIPMFLEVILPLMNQLGSPFEVIFINDGSRDASLPLLIAASNAHPQVGVLSFSRNFGKDIALTAGLDHASGKAVIPIDCDLQHPPTLIPSLVEQWRAGFDMVVAVRARRDEESRLRRTLSSLFYRVLGSMTQIHIPPNAGDFRLLDRKIVDILKQMPERCRFMKGLYAWPGFTSTTILFQAAPRAVNESRWSYWRLWNFALDGIFSFSTVPLRIWTYLGAICAAGAFVYLVITILQKLILGINAPGYASILSVLLFFNGMILVSNGVQGEYIARLFEEVKGRPLYVVAGRWRLSNARRTPTESGNPTAE